MQSLGVAMRVQVIARSKAHKGTGPWFTHCSN